MEELLMRKLSKISKENGVDIQLWTEPCGGCAIRITRDKKLKAQALIPGYYPDEEYIVNKIYELIEELNKKTITP